MSEAYFKIQKHTLPCQHIREYPHATAGAQEDVLHFVVNQYTPLDNLNASPGDLTIIAAHANGVGKELYEPLWDDLYQLSRERGHFKIRSIWIADVAHQGESGILNEGKLGDDPSWFDHPRDLLSMVNHFRDEMIRPMIGIGHSMGGLHVTNVALMHPRLFIGLGLIDPVIMNRSHNSGPFSPALASTFRRDIWPSREVAKETMLRNPFYTSWDPRAFDLWIQYGLRELPTLIYPSYPSQTGSGKPMPALAPGQVPVTLTTTKHQEVMTFQRSKHPAKGKSLAEYSPDPVLYPDLPKDRVTDSFDSSPYYRPEPFMTFYNLPHLRPPVHYIFAVSSNFGAHPIVLDKLRATGVGTGGNGGQDAGKVTLNMLQGGHFVPFERPQLVAGELEEFFTRRLEGWRQEEQVHDRGWSRKNLVEKTTLDEDQIYWSTQATKSDEKKDGKTSKL